MMEQVAGGSDSSASVLSVQAAGGEVFRLITGGDGCSCYWDVAPFATPEFLLHARRLLERYGPSSFAGAQAYIVYSDGSDRFVPISTPEGFGQLPLSRDASSATFLRLCSETVDIAFDVPSARRSRQVVGVLVKRPEMLKGIQVLTGLLEATSKASGLRLSDYLRSEIEGLVLSVNT